MQLCQGKVDFQTEKLGLALEPVVCFLFEHTDKPYCPFVEILSGILCSYQRWTQDVPSPWSLDFWNPSYGIKREGTFISRVWLGQNHFISCIWVFSNLTKAAYWMKKLKWYDKGLMVVFWRKNCHLKFSYCWSLSLSLLYGGLTVLPSIALNSWAHEILLP